MMRVSAPTHGESESSDMNGFNREPLHSSGAVWTNVGNDQRYMEGVEDGITVVIGVLAARDSAACHQPAYIAS